MSSTRLRRTDLPPAVAAIAGVRPVRLVWTNALGGLTFEVGERPGHQFVKWNPHGNAIDLAAEAARLRWAGQYLSTVPRVLDEGADDAGAWLVTSPLPGEMAVADRWKRDPATAVRVIGEGLRAFHDALPVAECPFAWDIESRLAYIERLGPGVSTNPDDWHPDLRHLAWEGALDLLRDRPPEDHLVVCHGDTCAPNTLVSDDGRFAGHVDLGSMGTADRWADIAIAAWSLEWNYGPGWSDLLHEAYGVDPDRDLTFYYRLLWDLCP